MVNDKARGNDSMKVGAKLNLKEHGKVKAMWKIYKFLGDFPHMTAEQIMAKGIKPYEVLEYGPNLMLNDGYNNVILQALVGAAPTYLNGTDGCMGVGDSSTGASASQTALQAASNHLWVLLSATPTVGSNQQLVASASFSTSQANWTWNEIMLGTTTTPASLPSNSAAPPATAYVINRLVTGMGTKVSTATWVATVTITFS